jgi:hypothetical protein
MITISHYKENDDKETTSEIEINDALIVINEIEKLMKEIPNNMLVTIAFTENFHNTQSIWPNISINFFKIKRHLYKNIWAKHHIEIKSDNKEVFKTLICSLIGSDDDNEIVLK